MCLCRWLYRHQSGRHDAPVFLHAHHPMDRKAVPAILASHHCESARLGCLQNSSFDGATIRHSRNLCSFAERFSVSLHILSEQPFLKCFRVHLGFCKKFCSQQTIFGLNLRNDSTTNQTAKQPGTANYAASEVDRKSAFKVLPGVGAARKLSLFAAKRNLIGMIVRKSCPGLESPLQTDGNCRTSSPIRNRRTGFS